jgi:hypothetical protein
LAALVYLASAPPIMMSIIKRYGFSSQAPGLWLYTPVFRLLESDFKGPVVWYFNSVWGTGVEYFGADQGWPWYVLAVYALVGAALLALVALPFWRKWRRKRVSGPNHSAAGKAGITSRLAIGRHRPGAPEKV